MKRVENRELRVDGKNWRVGSRESVVGRRLSLRWPIILSIAFTFLLLLPTFDSPLTTAHAQRDYFTPEEIELIRDAQEIDRRIDILTKAVDRRFGALKVDVGGAKFTAKDAETWGVLPESTRFQLLFDIKRILQKAIDDIDSLSERPDSIVLPDPKDKDAKNQGFAQLFPKAVHNLAKAATRYRPALKAQLDIATDAAEKGSILDAIDMCDQITDAVKKLPGETGKNKN